MCTKIYFIVEYYAKSLQFKAKKKINDRRKEKNKSLYPKNNYAVKTKVGFLYDGRSYLSFDLIWVDLHILKTQ